MILINCNTMIHFAGPVLAARFMVENPNEKARLTRNMKSDRIARKEFYTWIGYLIFCALYLAYFLIESHMFLSDSDILDRVASPDNLVNRLTVHEMHGNRMGRGQVPDEIRKVSALLTAQGETQTSVAEEFGISNKTVHNYANGRTNNLKSSMNEELKEVIDGVKLKRVVVEDKAISALLESLNIMTPQLADVSKPATLSKIARDMAAVAKDISGRSDNENQKQVHLHIYRPQMKNISDYETIDAENV